MVNNKKTIEWMWLILGLMLYFFGFIDVIMQKASGGRINQVYYNIKGSKAVLLGIILIIVSLIISIVFFKNLKEILNCYKENYDEYGVLLKIVISFYLVHPFLILLLKFYYEFLIIFITVVFVYIIFSIKILIKIYKLNKIIK